MSAQQARFNNYRNAVISGENAYDALGTTENIIEKLSPQMLVAVLAGDFVLAKKLAEQIMNEAAADYACIDLSEAA